MRRGKRTCIGEAVQEETLELSVLFTGTSYPTPVPSNGPFGNHTD